MPATWASGSHDSDEFGVSRDDIGLLDGGAVVRLDVIRCGKSTAAKPAGLLRSSGNDVSQGARKFQYVTGFESSAEFVSHKFSAAVGVVS